MNLETVIMPLVAALYGLVEAIKWIKKGQISNTKSDHWKEQQAVMVEKLRKMETTIDNRAQQHMDVMLILRDVTHMLKDISKSQKQISEAQAKIAVIIRDLRAK